MSTFDFNPGEIWEPSLDTLLPVGNHVVRITELKAGKSTGGYPQVIVRGENASGVITDWITISTPNTFGKFTAVVLALGVEKENYPKVGVDFDADNGAVSQEYLDALMKVARSKDVGVVVREEPDYKDPSKMRRTVAGWVDAARIRERQSDVTSPTESASFAGVGIDFSGAASSSRPAGEDNVPF